MQAIHELIAEHLLVACAVMALAFIVLAKCADLFVDSSVDIAGRMRIPKLVIGIVLVSLVTTAPELAVSLMAALGGKPEMALGNAVGSVICNSGLALGLCGLISATAITVIPRVFKAASLFLILISVLAFLGVIFDQTLSRIEGSVLVLLFAGYLAYLFKTHQTDEDAEHIVDEHQAQTNVSVMRLIVVFAISLGGIVIAGRFIVLSAVSIARFMHMPETIIALTLVALGTSIPEVATCVTAARKGEGSLAVGNVLGANVMNICWVAGASAMANPLKLGRRELYFMFPAMFVITGAMLLVLRTRHRLTRNEGLVLLVLYAAYLAGLALFFRPT